MVGRYAGLMTAHSSKPPETEGDPNRRSRILMVASQEFSQRGRAAVRVDEIARRAKVNKQLIYYYFGSKDALYTAVLEWMVEESLPMWAEVQEADLAAGIARLIDNPPHPQIDWLRLLAWEGLEYGGPDEPSDIVLHERRIRAYQTEVGLFTRARDAGQLDDDIDPEMLALTLFLLKLSVKAVPQVVSMLTGLQADGPEFHARTKAFVNDLLSRMSPR